MKNNKKKINWKIVIYSLTGLACLVLVFIVDWLFIIPAVIVMILNQREIFRERKKK